MNLHVRYWLPACFSTFCFCFASLLQARISLLCICHMQVYVWWARFNVHAMWLVYVWSWVFRWFHMFSCVCRYSLRVSMCSMLFCVSYRLALVFSCLEHDLHMCLCVLFGFVCFLSWLCFYIRWFWTELFIISIVLSLYQAFDSFIKAAHVP